MAEQFLKSKWVTLKSGSGELVKTYIRPGVFASGLFAPGAFAPEESTFDVSLPQVSSLQKNLNEYA